MVTLSEVQLADYDSYFEEGIFENKNIFSSGKFNAQYHYKADSIKGLIFRHRSRVIAGIILGIKEENGIKVARSPFSGTYGGFIYSCNITAEESFDVVKLLSNYLKQIKTHKLFIQLLTKECSQCINDNLLFAMLKNQYHLADIELDFFIELNKNYEMYFTYACRKNIRKAEKANFLFIEDASRLKEAYDLIAKNRKERGYYLSMTFDEVKNMFELFSDRTFCFLLMKDGEVAASSINYLIDDTHVICVYWAHNSKLQAYRPLNLLVKKSCEWIMKKYPLATIYDFGISTLNSEPNWGLIRFKESFGAKTSVKYMLEKSFGKENTYE